jgi:hypothetical protein
MAEHHRTFLNPLRTHADASAMSETLTAVVNLLAGNI